MWLLQEKFPLVQKLTALDISKDKKFGIAGVIQNNKPVLVFFTFDASMKIVGSINLDCSPKAIREGITGLRVSTTKENTVYASTRSHLHIFHFEAKPETRELSLSELGQVDYQVDVGSFCELCI